MLRVWLMAVLLASITYMQSPLSSQIPEDWPKMTQLALQALSFKTNVKRLLQRNPASTWMRFKAMTKMIAIFIFNTGWFLRFFVCWERLVNWTNWRGWNISNETDDSSEGLVSAYESPTSLFQEEEEQRTTKSNPLTLDEPNRKCPIHWISVLGISGISENRYVTIYSDVKLEIC